MDYVFSLWVKYRPAVCLKFTLQENGDLDYCVLDYTTYEKHKFKIYKFEDLLDTIDCNITENYLKERNKMTNNCDSQFCGDCVLNTTELSCAEFEIARTREAIKLVQEWSDKHYNKTYKEDFLEKYPEADLVDGYPRLCPCYIYPSLKTRECQYGVSDSCKDCWDSCIEAL